MIQHITEPTTNRVQSNVFELPRCGGGRLFSQQEAIEERQKYVSAFNDTMIKIWKEQMTLLGVIDTGSLLRSTLPLSMSADGKFSQVSLSQTFLEYGLYQDYGTGGEVPRGNSGDLGREKKRQRRRWFSRKYYASVMNIKEFMAESLGKEFLGVVSSAFSRKKHFSDCVISWSPHVFSCLFNCICLSLILYMHINGYQQYFYYSYENNL